VAADGDDMSFGKTESFLRIPDQQLFAVQLPVPRSHICSCPYLKTATEKLENSSADGEYTAMNY
jgi:hypothetical protein